MSSTNNRKNHKRQSRNKDQRQRKKRGLTVFPHVTYFGAKAIETVLRACVDEKAPEPTTKDWNIIEAILPELADEIKACEERHKKWEARQSAKDPVETDREREIQELVAKQVEDMKETGHGEAYRSGASGADSVPDEERDQTNG